MTQNNQDDLAAEWAASLEAEEAEKAGTDTMSDDERLAAEWAAALADDGNKDDDALASEWAAALAEDEQKAVSKEKSFYSTPQSIDAHFKDMTEASKAPRPDGARRELDFILDIPLDVSAELGRTRLLINELLQLGQGSVVELNKLAGEPLEVYVNGKLVARGEAVVINEKFGVRLTDIISPMERVKQLG